MNTRTDAEGNKVLFLEEVQSDWGQKGKKEGFRTNEKEIAKKIESEIRLKYNIPNNERIIGNSKVPYEEQLKLSGASIKNENTISQAPFVTDTNAWTKLGLKVALKEAVTQGADKIAWTTGEQQNDRYDLSKQVDEIEVLKSGNEYSIFGTKDGRKSGFGEFTKEQLPGVVGKELAQKIVDSYPDGVGGRSNFKGKDLQVGGSGMKGFYGSMPEKINLLHLLNDKGEIDYGKISKIADEIAEGLGRIERLSQTEEQGRRRGGKTNVEATLVLRANQEANRGRQKGNSKAEIITEQESALSKYADEKNKWVNEKEVAANALEQLPSGFESHVYLSKDGKTVTKFVNYRVLDNTPESFIDNRISLFNHIAGDSEAHYTFKGFAKNPETGQLQFVVEQPYVEGKNVDFINPTELKAFDGEMQKRGFNKLADGVYISPNHALFDVKNGNVKITPKGNYVFIDIVPKLNGKKTGGAREYGNGDVFGGGSLGIVGNVAKSLWKQEPHTITLQDGTTQHSITVTPEMREQAQQGQPLFMFVSNKNANLHIPSGINGKSLGENFNIAVGMDADGASADETKIATGWSKAGDGKWRYEISDEGAKLKVVLPEKGQEIKGKLGDILEHPRLFALYPQLSNIKINLKNVGDYNAGGFIPSDNGSTINIETDGTTQGTISEIIHEVQHAVQHISGLASGASNEIIFERKKAEYRAKNGKDPDATTERLLADRANKEYLATYGEIEARASQNNISLSEHERIFSNTIEATKRKYGIKDADVTFPLQNATGKSNDAVLVAEPTPANPVPITRKVYNKLVKLLQKSGLAKSVHDAKDMVAYLGKDGMKAFRKMADRAKKAIPERIVKTVSEAQDAIKPLIGKPITNNEFGITATLSGNSIGKLGSEKATAKSVSPRIHALAVANIDKLFESAELHDIKQDNKGTKEVEQVHKLGTVLYDPETKQYYPVKITAKEYVNPKDGTRIYSIEAVDVENQKSAGQLVSLPKGQKTPFADFDAKLQKIAEEANNPTKAMAVGDTKKLEQEGDAINNATNIRPMQTPHGEILGFVTPDGKVYLDTDNLRADTPIHEFGHLWNSYTKQNHPELWEKGKLLVKDSPYWQQVLDLIESNPDTYGHLQGNENAIADEALARGIGDKGAIIFNGRNKSLAAQFKAWLKDVWNAISGKAGIRDLTPSQVQKLSLDKFMEMAGEDLLSGRRLKDGGQAQQGQPLFMAQMQPYLDDSELIKDKDGNVTGIKPEVAEAIRKERNRIEAEAKANGTWMKAPNGKQSKLSESQWITVRTSRFKDNFFGDWELMQKEVVPISVNINHGFKNYREAEQWAKENNIAGTYTNKDTGEKIKVSNKSFEKMTHDTAVEKSTNKDIHLAAIKQLPKLLEDAVLGERHADRDGNPHIKEVQRLYAAVNVDGKIHRAKLTVKAYADKGFNNKAYSYEVTEIEMLGGKSADTDFKEPVSSRTPSISVANLLKNATKNNGQRFDTEYSKVVDENGEPLVVYHGTGEDIIEFKKSKLGSQETEFFFTTSKDAAKDYGKNVIPVFLNIREFGKDGQLIDETGAGIGDTSKEASVEISVSNPNQIKSATANVGTFSNETGDIRFMASSISNSNTNFIEDEKTKYYTTSEGEKIPYRAYTPGGEKANNDTSPNLLQRQENTGEDNDFALVERQFTEFKQLNFTAGTKIESLDDVAWLFRNLENEAVEHSFAVYIMPNGSYVVQHLSTGGVAATVVDGRLVSGNAVKMRAKSVVSIHNHPSGKLIVNPI